MKKRVNLSGKLKEFSAYVEKEMDLGIQLFRGKRNGKIQQNMLRENKGKRRKL